MSFDKLPDEMLLIIFEYCDPMELIQLNKVCYRFYQITERLFNKRSKDLLITSERMVKFRDRCFSTQSTRSKYSTCYNWKKGIYVKTKLSNSNMADPNGHMTYICNVRRLLGMTKNTVLLKSYPKGFYAFNRTKFGKMRNYSCIHDYSVICNIIPCDDVFFTNHVGGSINVWTLDINNKSISVDKTEIKSNEPSYMLYKDSVSYGYDYIMDVTSRHIALGAGRGKIKIMKYSREENIITEENIISESQDKNLNPSFYMNVLAFDPTGAKLIANHLDHDPRKANYVIYDINKGCTETVRKLDINYVNQLSWEDNNSILLKGNTEIKKVDLRTHNVVQTWMSPLNVRHEVQRIFTCMSTDYQYAVMTGTLRGEVVLYDQRQSSLVQIYNKSQTCCGMRPNKLIDRIQALEFDNSQMYVLSDTIYELDFSKAAQKIRQIFY